ncbi:hypothetical protein TNCV_5024291 [Trichonephila clavipes]|nr:hypothetical protein TNCV_5024291 [Trichonephila clavipes]
MLSCLLPIFARFIVVANATCLTQVVIKAHEIPHGKRLHCTPVIRSFEPYAGDSTIWLVSTLILRPLWVVRGIPPLFPFPPISREDLRLDGYLEYLYAEKAQYIYKHPCLLRHFDPRPYGTVVNVSTHYRNLIYKIID